MTAADKQTNNGSKKHHERKLQSTIVELWRDRVRNEILPKILQRDIPLFSADIILGQTIIIHLPIAKYFNPGSWRDKLSDMHVSLVYIEETLEKKELTKNNIQAKLITENCPIIYIRKYETGGGFIEIEHRGALIAISFCQEGTPSTYNSIPFREIYHSC